MTIFGYFTAIGLLFFGYRYVEYMVSREHVTPLDPLTNELFTGAWMAALLFPLVARFARRFPIERSNWTRRVPLHIGALLAYSFTHSSLLWAGRSVLYPLFGLGRYDYGIMKARYPMEFFHDVISYAVMVSILYLFDRHVRAAQLEGKLAQARLEKLRLQLQPHFLFNAGNTISAAVYEDPRKADAMIAQLSNLLRRSISDADTQIVPSTARWKRWSCSSQSCGSGSKTNCAWTCAFPRMCARRWRRICFCSRWWRIPFAMVSIPGRMRSLSP